MTPPIAQPEAPQQEARRTPIVTTADLAECNCPEFCERDHELD